jgi:hypothetical protein
LSFEFPAKVIAMQFVFRASHKVCVSVIAFLVVILSTQLLAVSANPSSRQKPAKPAGGAAKSKVPAPVEVLGFRPGDDRKLASWAQFNEYFKALDKASGRVIFEELGKTTLNRPFVAATISSPANLAKLNRYKEIQR